MRVDELIAELSAHPADTIVCLASDEEWNSVKKVYQVDDSLTRNPLDYEVELVNEEDVENGEYFDWREDRELTVADYTRVLVIW